MNSAIYIPSHIELKDAIDVEQIRNRILLHFAVYAQIQHLANSTIDTWVKKIEQWSADPLVLGLFHAAGLAAQYFSLTVYPAEKGRELRVVFVPRIQGTSRHLGFALQMEDRTNLAISQEEHMTEALNEMRLTLEAEQAKLAPYVTTDDVAALLMVLDVKVAELNDYVNTLPSAVQTLLRNES